MPISLGAREEALLAEYIASKKEPLHPDTFENDLYQERVSRDMENVQHLKSKRAEMDRLISGIDDLVSNVQKLEKWWQEASEPMRNVAGVTERVEKLSSVTRIQADNQQALYARVRAMLDNTSVPSYLTPDYIEQLALGSSTGQEDLQRACEAVYAAKTAADKEQSELKGMAAIKEQRARTDRIGRVLGSKVSDFLEPNVRTLADSFMQLQTRTERYPLTNALSPFGPVLSLLGAIDPDHHASTLAVLRQTIEGIMLADTDDEVAALAGCTCAEEFGQHAATILAILAATLSQDAPFLVELMAGGEDGIRSTPAAEEAVSAAVVALSTRAADVVSEVLKTLPDPTLVLSVACLVEQFKDNSLNEAKTRSTNETATALAAETLTAELTATIKEAGASLIRDVVATHLAALVSPKVAGVPEPVRHVCDAIGQVLALPPSTVTAGVASDLVGQLIRWLNNSAATNSKYRSIFMLETHRYLADRLAAYRDKASGAVLEAVSRDLEAVEAAVTENQKNYVAWIYIEAFTKFLAAHNIMTSASKGEDGDDRVIRAAYAKAKKLFTQHSAYLNKTVDGVIKRISKHTQDEAVITTAFALVADRFLADYKAFHELTGASLGSAEQSNIVGPDAVSFALNSARNRLEKGGTTPRIHGLAH
ncbi:Exocyst complex, component 1/SEC3 [Carpediemonas membranifera]|uniref:Exocyst complex, component 1/SEC3 n=1 Tax=Carpediemonas membranifera TaxID=201153 RepID=A0A8J6E174_9EUKA|nr:Exocyst complex, component 1/SEC3 [Carpediemonas membranifera]|eukprot:KAG9392726.1 Exocyst complex, component 1/SEC3 [Carpediemonas membranifera]